MQIAKGMDEVARSEIHNLRHHHRKQRVRGDIERDTEKQICASLIKLTSEVAILYVKLEEERARRHRHLADLSRISRAFDKTSAFWICIVFGDPLAALSHPTILVPSP